jgi:hypothetical protein
MAFGAFAALKAFTHAGFGQDTGILLRRQSLRERAFMPAHDSYLSTHACGKTSLGM